MNPNSPLVFVLSLVRSRAARRRVLLVTAAVVAAGAAYAFLAPKWYSANVTVVPAKQQRSGLGGLSSLVGGDVAGLAAGLDVGGGGTDVQRIAAVLQSNAVSDAVIEKFQLGTRYKQRTVEATREELWSHCTVKPMPKPGLVELACEDKDPVFLQSMLAFFAEHGNEVFKTVSVSSATEEVRFLEKRVAELRSDADELATKVRTFQEEHRIVDIDSQSRALVSTFATLQAQRISKQMEIDYARTFSAQGEDTVRQLQSQLAVIDDNLKGLQEPGDPDASGAAGARARSRGQGLLPPALSVPKLRAEYEKLYRNRKVGEASLVFALERLESAKANEARDTSTFQILDPPTVATRKSRPKRLRIILAAAVLGLAAALFHEWWRDAGGFSVLRAALREREAAAPPVSDGASGRGAR